MCNNANKLLPLLCSIFSFNLFKSIKLKYNPYINFISQAVFGVLCIHANSNTMRKFLWGDLLQNVAFYNSKYLYLHSVLSILGVFCVCTVIEILRIKILEKVKLACKGRN